MRRQPRHLSTPLRHAMIASLSVLLAACSHYDFTFNEQPLGPTPALAEKIQLTDPGLAECVDRTVHDQRISQLNQLTRLSCPQSSIRSVDGIAQLSQLGYLNLSGNRLSDASALVSLTALEEVDLRGNKQLNCSAVSQLQARGVRVRAPAHCR